MTVFDSLRWMLHRAAPRRTDAATPGPFHDHRRRAYRPIVEALEARLPLGDGVLSGVVGWWLGSSLVPLETQLRASDDVSSPVWAASSLAEPSNVEKLTGSFRFNPSPAAERLPPSGARYESARLHAAVSWDTLPVWQPHEPVIRPHMYGTTPVAPTPFALSLPSAGGTAVPLAVTVSPANFQPSSAPGGTRLSAPTQLGSPTVSSSAASPRLHDFGRTPLSFEVNQGQTDKQVDFLAHGPGYTVFLTSTEAVLALRPPHPAADTSALASLPGQKTGLVDSALAPAGGQAESGAGAVVRMQLLDSNAAAHASGGQRLPGIVNYFLGNNPEQWHTRIPTYAQVQYQNVYPGINLVYYSNEQQLEYDFQVAPGADPAQIHLGFAGAQSVSVDAATGDLMVQAGGQVLRQHAPVVYQEVAGQRREVAAGFVVQGPQVSFVLGGYDPSQPLVIDPVLSYATYLGGSGDEYGNQIAVDAAGNAYLWGTTFSVNGDNDTFVAKLTADGSTLAYFTHLGGSGDVYPYGIAVDAAGNAYITGNTSSPDFPTANPLQPVLRGGRDAFVVRLTADGSALTFSTYLGGSDVDGGLGIAVDVAGNAYVTGSTKSLDFPTVNALQPGRADEDYNDAFVAKLTGDGSALVYSTYLGGRRYDIVTGIAVDMAGNAYVAGTTDSVDFPTANALQPAYAGGGWDAFMAKLTADGSTLVYSTYLGGSEAEYGRGIAVDAAGNAFVTGITNSRDFPTVNALQPIYRGGSRMSPYDAFVAELATNGAALVYSTYLGGSDGEVGLGIAVDPAGSAYVTGATSSPDFPTANPLQSTYAGGDTDMFVAELTVDGSALVYATYLGGRGREEGDAIAVDAAGNAYVAGLTSSLDFPTVNPLQPAYGGGEYGEAFVAKISP